MDQLETVYVDKSVLINELYLKIFKYYLPLATSKTIFFQEISYIIYHRKRSIDVVWGASSDKLKDWFPFDKKRPAKKGYFQIVLRDKGIRPCFSLIDPERVFSILWMNHSKEGMIYKEQYKKSIQPIILLSQRPQDLNIPLNGEREEIMIENQDNLVRPDNVMVEIKKEMIREREAFQDLTNSPLKDWGMPTNKKFERFSRLKQLQFEEEILGEHSQQKENNELIDDVEFEDLE